jgi:hypothetical protein
VKARLRNITFAKKADEGRNKPTLRTKTEQADKKNPIPNGNPDDDRPTLKRRPDSP